MVRPFQKLISRKIKLKIYQIILKIKYSIKPIKYNYFSKNDFIVFIKNEKIKFNSQQLEKIFNLVESKF